MFQGEWCFCGDVRFIHHWFYVLNTAPVIYTSGFCFFVLFDYWAQLSTKNNVQHSNQITLRRFCQTLPIMWAVNPCCLGSFPGCSGLPMAMPQLFDADSNVNALCKFKWYLVFINYIDAHSATVHILSCCCQIKHFFLTLALHWINRMNRRNDKAVDNIL